MSKKKAALAIEQQYDLARWWATDEGLAYSRGFLRDVYAADDRELTDLQLIQQAAVMREQQHHWLLQAKTFYVTANMVRTAEAFAKTMEPQPLREDMLPCIKGFLQFEIPTYVTDLNRRTCNVQGILWGPGAPGDLGTWHANAKTSGVNITTYSNPDDPQDSWYEVFQDLKQQQREGDKDTIKMGPLIMLGSDPWPFGQNWSDPNSFDFYGKERLTPEAIEEAAGLHIDLRRFLMALWSLMQQTIVISKAVPLDRKVARRMSSQGLLLDDIDLKVVVLRRELEQAEHYEKNPNAAPVDWSHQWEVEGHKRWQWYPGNGVAGCQHCGRLGGEHRQIWIDSYVKGPPDKPLIPKNTVYHVRR